MAIGDDFSITPQLDGTYEIDYTGTTATYRGITVYRWLQGLADDANYTGDDIVDVSFRNLGSRQTDQVFTMLNGFFFTEAALQHMYDASITQKGGDEIWGGLRVVGTNENAGVVIQIVQDGALYTDFWTGGLENDDAAAQILLDIILPRRLDGYDIDGGRILTKAHHLSSTYAEFPTTLIQNGVAVAALTTVNDNFNQTVAGTIATWTDIVLTEGYNLIDVEGDAVAEPFYVSTDLGTRTKNNLYERAKWITREGSAETLFGLDGEIFRGVTHSFDFDNESAAFTEGETIAWGTSFAFDNGVGTFTLGEYVEDTTSGAVGKIVYYTGAGATGTLVIAKEPGSGTIADPGAIVGLTSGATCDVNGVVTGNSVVGGTAQLLALEDAGASVGSMYIQLLTGVAPLDNDEVIGQTSDSTADVDGTPVARTVSPVFVGSSTGSAILGAYGFGIEAADLGANDRPIDLTGTTLTPPNNQQFTVNGLEVGEDYVVVGPRVADAIEEDQFTGATGNNASGAGTWVVNEAIPADTPSSGTVRVFDGFTFQRVPFTSWSGSTFTLTGTLPSAGASHTLAYDNEGGTPPWSLGETLTFGGGGTAELLNFIDGVGVGADEGYMVIRMLTGSDPIDNDTITGGTSGATADVNGAPTDAGGYISYIDKLAGSTSESVTMEYQSDRDLRVRLRDGDVTPIVPFETNGTLSATGGSATAVRTADT